MFDPANPPMIFLSHATADDETVTRLHDALEAALPNPCWADHHDITPGASWQSVIDQALDSCGALIVTMSHTSAQSEEVAAEWRDALLRGKPVYVAIIDDLPLTAIPSRLRMIQFVNLHADWDAGLAQLIAAIRAEFGSETGAAATAHIQRGALSAVLYRDSVPVLGAPQRLIGRDDLIAAITPQIAQRQRILVHGFGGEGKTALVATLAQQQLAADSGPVLWLQAGSSDAATIFEALAAPLNGRQALAGQTGDALLVAVQGMITASGVKLVVLDDVWNGQALARVLRALPPTVAVLITSRARYPIPVQHALGGLDADAARELISHYYGQDMRETPEVDDLAADLGYHAYALEIAARTMLADVLTPAEIRARIAAAPHTLTMPEFFAEAGRASIGGLLQISLDALDDEARAAFLAFGAFAAPILTAELLAIYLDRDPTASLDTLVRRGLVERLAADDQHVARLRVHDLAHSYARANAGDEAPGQGVAACVALMARYNSPSLENFSALRPLLPVLLGASETAEVLGRDADVERFAWDLYGGSEILDYGGYYTQALPILRRAAIAAERQGDRRNQGAHLSCLGLVYADLEEVSRAIEYYEQALDITREIGDRCGEGQCLGNLGNAHSSQGEVSRAIEYYEQALDITREIGDRRGEGNSLGNLGIAYGNLGELEQAIEYYEQALVIRREIGDRRGEGNDLGNLGNAYADLGEVERAIEYHEQALVIVREIGDRRGEGHILGNLGLAYADLGEVSRAIEYYEQSRAIYAALNLPHDIEWVDGLLARARAQLTDSED